MNSRVQSELSPLKSRYTLEQLQQAVSAYGDRFKDPVPLDLLTAAASTFRSTELMTILLDCIRSNSPVADWHEFTVKFRHRLE